MELVGEAQRNRQILGLVVNELYNAGKNLPSVLLVPSVLSRFQCFANARRISAHRLCLSGLTRDGPGCGEQ